MTENKNNNINNNNNSNNLNNLNNNNNNHDDNPEIPEGVKLLPMSEFFVILKGIDETVKNEDILNEFREQSATRARHVFRNGKSFHCASVEFPDEESMNEAIRVWNHRYHTHLTRDPSTPLLVHRGGLQDRLRWFQKPNSRPKRKKPASRSQSTQQHSAKPSPPPKSQERLLLEQELREQNLPIPQDDQPIGKKTLRKLERRKAEAPRTTQQYLELIAQPLPQSSNNSNSNSNNNNSKNNLNDNSSGKEFESWSSANANIEQKLNSTEGNQDKLSELKELVTSDPQSAQEKINHFIATGEVKKAKLIEYILQNKPIPKPEHKTNASDSLTSPSSPSSSLPSSLETTEQSSSSATNINPTENNTGLINLNEDHHQDLNSESENGGFMFHHNNDDDGDNNDNNENEFPFDLNEPSHKRQRLE